jgi:hypothetical protein
MKTDGKFSYKTGKKRSDETIKIEISNQIYLINDID